jgi:acyl-CoA reductase-like NAD-dependent aldehyde dehydrogenase
LTAPSETQGQAVDPIIQRMQEVFERQRQAFLSHPFPTLAERKAKLRSLRSLLQRYQDRIVAAVSADFGGRAPAETKLAEVLGPVFEINHALHALRGWMKPRKPRASSSAPRAWATWWKQRRCSRFSLALWWTRAAVRPAPR